MNPSFATRFALIGAGLTTLVACTQSTDDEVDSSADRIVGGTEAAEGAWPGTAAVYRGGSRPSCGGSLVADSWVLTAGHCVTPDTANGGISKIVVGRRTLSTTAGEERTVDKVIRHAGYANLDNDLALLHLSQPSTMPTAKIVRANQLTSLVAGANTTVVGWGVTTEGGSLSDVLRQVTVPIIPSDKCKSYPRYDRVTDNMICAGFETGTMDSCQGDSGGPLFMTIDGETVEVGLVSWGIGCARPSAPGVYTRLGNYLAWLYEQTGGAVGEAAPPSPPVGPSSGGSR